MLRSRSAHLMQYLRRIYKVPKPPSIKVVYPNEGKVVRDTIKRRKPVERVPFKKKRTKIQIEEQKYEELMDSLREKETVLLENLI